MSYKATNWAYELPLRGSAKPVLVALADMADEAGSCFPSQARIATMTGLGERTVRRSLCQLEELGLISRLARYGGTDGRKSDRYVLAVGKNLPANLTTGQSDHRPESPNLPANLTKPTGHSGQGTINEPSLNHQIGEVIEIGDLPDGTTQALPIPDPFVLTDEMKVWAEANTPGVNAASATQDFVAYWRYGEGKGKRKKNWTLTWRNFMKKQQSWLPASQQKPRKVKQF